MQNSDHNQQLVNYLLGEATPEEKVEFQAQLETCPEKIKEVENTQSLIEAMRLEIPEELSADRRTLILSKCNEADSKTTRPPTYLQFLKISGIAAAMVVVAFMVSQKKLSTDSNQTQASKQPVIDSNYIDPNDYHIKTAMIGGDNQDGQCIIDISRTKVKASTQTKPVVTTVVLDTSSLKSPKVIKQQLDHNLRLALRSMQSHDRISLIICGVKSSARPTNQSNYTINQIIATIGQIRLTKSTSLKEGVYRGYQHALNRFDKKAANKLIFLASTKEPINLLDRQQITNCLNECPRQQIALATVGFDHLL